MDARIEGFKPFPMPTPRQQRQDQGERNFYLPRGGADSDADAQGEDPADAEDHHVLEPMPPRASSDKPVSRTRLSDELGHRIDVRG